LIVDSVLSDAKAYLKGEIVDCNIAVEGGKIFKIGKQTNMPKADEKISLNHMLVLPGVIDAHVHLRDEERAYKETFLSGTAAAAEGGVTTVLDMPNNAPITMSAETLRNRMELAGRRVLVNVGFYSEFPEDLAEITEIVQTGAVGFKLFMGDQVGGLDIDNDQALSGALAEITKLGVPLAVHAEDHLMIKNAAEQLKLSNRHTITDFLKAHDEVAEVEAVERLLGLAEKTQVHFCHISTEKALGLLDEAKEAGKPVTCEATPHHLLLTKDVYSRLGKMALTLPPLRNREDADALWKGVAGGSVDTIGSDHAPHELQEKDAASVWDTKAGVPGLETMLPLMLTEIHKNRLTLERLIHLLCEKPAEIFGLADRGRLEEGKTADLTVVDFNRKYRIDASKFESKAKFSPFDKWDVQGKTVRTFVCGALVMEDGEILAKPGWGTVLRRQRA
jgi:dihydroorotase (multifunctional complex type)